ncbi:MAG: hypothetical protein AAGA92_12985 [Planctomycetota bacterium]
MISLWHKHAPLACFAVAVLAALAFLAVRVPVPRVHDEFSYLLAADTYASGRLTNPAHPHWQHFESFHTIHQPSYASKYQPGQGGALAVGQALFGHPIHGSVLASGCAAAAVCWMLAAWLPPRWALCGGLLIALHPLILANWTLSYWGGALPMAAGALVFGASKRIADRPHITDAALLGIGATLLAATRPFEGLVLCLCVGVALLAAFWKSQEKQRLLLRGCVPTIGTVAAGLAMLAAYNHAVTGSAARMPYQVHEQTYGVSPLFLWQDAKPEPDYRHRELRRYYTGWGIEDFDRQRDLVGWADTKRQSMAGLLRFFAGGAMFLPVAAAVFTLRDPRTHLAWLALAASLAAALCVPWTYPHYLAPAAPLLLLLAVAGLRRGSVALRRSHPVAKHAVAAVLALQLVTLAGQLVLYARWQPEGWEFDRARILDNLEATGERHLVFVRYAPNHNVHAEWVYNRADIDAAPVVWAREMSPGQNAALIEHDAGRRVWLLKPDVEPRVLLPYPTH